uniref:Ig-like domain-containing protein n=1 Tax=Oryzias latipes TaxID=8090 RepID=A0A3P9K550_ORYLA
MKIVVLFGFVLSALPAAAKHFFGRVNQKVTLECGISTKPSTLEWLNDEKLVLKVLRGLTSRASNSNEHRQKYILRDSNLEINNLKTEDAGKFTCKVNRESQEHWLHLVSVDASPSDALQEGSEAWVQCEVHSSDQSSTVKWLMPDGSPIHDKRVSLKPVKASHGGTWTCEVKAAGQSFTTSLTITVTPPAPRTTKPSLNPSTKDSMNNTCVSCRADHPADIPLLLGLHWWVWVALGVSSLILILLIISIVLMSRRARRRKKRFQMMKKAQQQGPKKYCQCQSRQPAAKPAEKAPRRGRREKPSPLPLQPLLTE